jgi:predicted amidophosphoribosyltransferase
MAVVKTSPMKLPATPWVVGYVLDYHTISSTPTGDPYYRFDTKRTELGELLFQLKYRGGGNVVVSDIVDTAQQFIGAWKPPIECLVPAPPSLTRKTQPVVELARELAMRLGLPMCENAVIKVKATHPMKNIDDWWERQRVLEEAIQGGQGDVKGKSDLLFDDLIESGSTLRRAADVLLKEKAARAVYALVLTRTR